MKTLARSSKPADPSPETTGTEGLGLYDFSSTAIRWITPTRLSFKGQLEKEETVDLARYVLPPMSFTEQRPIRLLERPDLANALLHTLDVYASTNSLSKSLPLVLRELSHAVAKVIEFGWMNGAYRITDWTDQKFRFLADRLALGGWIFSLDTETRLRNYLAMDGQQAKSHDSVLFSIGTNSARGDLSGGLKLSRIKRRKGDPRSKKLPARWSLSNVGQRRIGRRALATILDHINIFGESNGLKRPFRHARSHAAKLLSDTGDRTASLSVDELARLMQNSVAFATESGPLLLKVFNELLQWRRMSPASPNPTLTDWESAYRNLDSTRLLETYLGRQTRLTPKRSQRELNLYAVVRAYQAASFYPLCFMNARRKDEIIHPEIGIQSSTLRLFDASQSLFIADFYIEKTHRSRVPFFVNSLTQELVASLVQFSNVAREFEKAHSFSVPLLPQDRESVFLVPDVRAQPGSANRIRGYKVGASGSSAWRFAAEKLEISVDSAASHIMRRGYALLFHYRYENAILAALSQQLGHFFIESTEIYITFHKNSGDLQSQAWGALSPSQRKVLLQDCEERSAAVRAVGNEKLHLLVATLMENDICVAGNFGKVIRRYIQLLSASLDFSQLDTERKVSIVAKSFEERGHRPDPMRHGNCWRGDSLSRHRGRCQSKKDQAANRSKANADLCNDCAYFSAMEQHTNNLRDESDFLDRSLSTMPIGTIAHADATKELHNIQRIIWLREQRAQVNE